MFSEEYVNPFGLDVDKDVLINVSYGVPLSASICEQVLSIPTTGKEKYKEFKTKRLVNPKSTNFHAPITRNKIQLFGEAKKRILISRDKVTNRDILGKLLSISSRRWKHALVQIKVI